MKSNQRRSFFRKAAAFFGLGTLVATVKATSLNRNELAPTTTGMFSDPFIGQIMAVGFNFAPPGWALCNGQILSIPQNTALFSLLGTTFGGDGETTFGLPDLRGRSIVGVGTGNGLPPVQWGQKSGSHENFLVRRNLPNENRSLLGEVKLPVAASVPDTDEASNAFLANQPEDHYGSTSTVGEYAIIENTQSYNLNTQSQLPVPNMHPFQGIYYCIALTGIFPSPN
jgi:microcystin-dependent protein